MQSQPQQQQQQMVTEKDKEEETAKAESESEAKVEITAQRPSTFNGLSLSTSSSTSASASVSASESSSSTLELTCDYESNELVTAATTMPESAIKCLENIPTNIDVVADVEDIKPIAVSEMATIAEVLKIANDHKVVENDDNVNDNNGENDALAISDGMVDVATDDSVKMTIKSSENSNVRKSTWRTKAEMKGNPPNCCAIESNQSHIDSDDLGYIETIPTTSTTLLLTRYTHDIDGRLRQTALTAEHIEAPHSETIEKQQHQQHQQHQQQQEQQQQECEEYKFNTPTQQQQDKNNDIETSQLTELATRTSEPTVNKTTATNDDVVVDGVGVGAGTGTGTEIVEDSSKVKLQSPAKPVKLIIERKRGRRFRCKQHHTSVGSDGMMHGRGRKRQQKVVKKGLWNSIRQSMQTLQLDPNANTSDARDARDAIVDCAEAQRSMQGPASLETFAGLMVRVPLSALTADFQQRHCIKQQQQQQHDSSEGNHNACLLRLLRDGAENTSAPDVERQVMKQQRDCLGDAESHGHTNEHETDYALSAANNAPDVPANVSAQEPLQPLFPNVNHHTSDQSDLAKFTGASHDSCDFVSQFQTQFIEAEPTTNKQQEILSLCVNAETQPLSATHLSEMQDVETTLNGILSEMQDQHIYTPVSAHTDDFLSQSVYSPLTEPPTTPSPSMYADVSSPYAQPQRQQTLDLPANNFPSYMGECFTEDSTQSELIGFQNDIPCFENIDQLSATTSAATTPKRQPSRTEIVPDVPAVVDYLHNTPTYATTTTAMQQLVNTEGVAIVNTSDGFVRTADNVDENLKEYANEYAQLLNEFHPPQRPQPPETPQPSLTPLPLSQPQLQQIPETPQHQVQAVTPQFMEINNDMQQMYTLKNGRLNLYAPSLTEPELQWTDPTRSQAATTAYFINTGDLYQTNNSLIPQIQQPQIQQQQHHLHLQQPVYEVHKRSIDANENYVQEQQQPQQQQQQQHQQQQLMILTIPPEATVAQQQYSNGFSTQTVYLQSPLATPIPTPMPTPTPAPTPTPTPTAVIHNTFGTSDGLNLLQNNNVGGAHYVTNLPLPALSPLSLPQHQQHIPHAQLQLQQYQQQHQNQQQTQQQQQQILQQQQKLSHQELLQLKEPKQKLPNKVILQKQEQQQQQQQQQSPLQPPQQETNAEAPICLMCRFCHKRQKFTNNRDYSNHIIAMHPAETPFNCPHCPLNFTRRIQRQQHIVSEHGAQRFECAPCGENFLTQRSLDLHLQRHHALDAPQQQLLQQQHQQQLQQKQQQEQEQKQQKKQKEPKQKKQTSARRYVRGGRGRGRLDGIRAIATPYDLVRVNDVNVHVHADATKDKRCEYHISSKQLDRFMLGALDPRR